MLAVVGVVAILAFMGVVGERPFVFTGICLTDRVGLGVLTRTVTREVCDDALLRTGRAEKRRRLLPARVVIYFVLALALFYRDSYEEVMRKLVSGLHRIGIWRKDWTMPTDSALCQARQRLGAAPLREVFEAVAAPCGTTATAGTFKRRKRLVALDGFEMHVPDTPANAEYFGYSGVKKKDKSPFPKLPVMALAECGTHAILAAEPGADGDTEHKLALRLAQFSGALEEDMLVLADRGLYSYNLMTAITDAGAHFCFRVRATVELPVLKWLPDGSYLSFTAEPQAKAKARRDLTSGHIKISDLPGIYVRVVDYEIPDREGNGKNELFTIVTSITDYEEMRGIELAEAYNERWEIEITYDEVETHQRGAAVILRSKSPEMILQEFYGLLITHYCIRQLMTEAADQAEVDPDRLSFTRSLNVIRRQVTGQAGFSPSTP